MSTEKDLELAKEITVAWLSAYKTDLAIRRQKGVVPLFTPTNEEVLNFVTAMYRRISDLSNGREIPEPEKDEAADSGLQFKKPASKIDILADLKKNLGLPSAAPHAEEKSGAEESAEDAEKKEEKEE